MRASPAREYEIPLNVRKDSFELEERLGLAKRFQQVQTGLEQILLEAAEIRDYNQQHDGAEKINTCANNIMQLAEQLRD